MATVLKDTHGPDWPLGFIEVLAPGTPVSIMSLVDPGMVNDPSASNRAGSTIEFTALARQILFQGFKPDTHGMQVNTGNVYIVRKNGDRDDYGTIVKVLAYGESWWLPNILSPNAMLSPYRYYVDADNANDGVVPVLFIY